MTFTRQQLADACKEVIGLLRMPPPFPVGSETVEKALSLTERLHAAAAQLIADGEVEKIAKEKQFTDDCVALCPACEADIALKDRIADGDGNYWFHVRGPWPCDGDGEYECGAWVIRERRFREQETKP